MPTKSWRVVLVVALALATWLASGFSSNQLTQAAPKPQAEASLAATPCTSGWQVVDSPNPGPISNSLLGLDQGSGGEIWAVGSYSQTGAFHTLTQRWSGGEWQTVASPDGNPGYSSLASVAIVSSNDVWAVGRSSDLNSPLTLTEHWDGSSWSVVASPALTESYLSDVAVITSANVLAVGKYNPRGDYDQPLMLRWSGTSWSKVTLPNVSGTNNYLDRLVVIAANDIWAVGERTSISYNVVPFMLHWDGTSWQLTDGPTRSGFIGLYNQFFNSISAVTSNDVWAVGVFVDSSNEVNGFVMHWDGTRWLYVPDPTYQDQPFKSVQAVTALAANDVWVAGYTNVAGPLLFAHWDGSSWSVPLVVANLTRPQVNDMIALSATELWAVGRQGDNGTRRTLTLHNTCTAPPPATSPTACALTFTDVPSSHPFYSDINYLACRGVISGYANSGGGFRFEPSSTTTRGQFAKIAIKGFGLPLINPTNPTYSDVPTTYTFYAYIETARNRGLISGYADGTFRPSQNITRAQVAKIVAAARRYQLLNPATPSFSDVPTDNFFYREIETLNAHNIISGGSCGTGRCFRPNDPITRGELSKVTGRAIQAP